MLAPEPACYNSLGSTHVQDCSEISGFFRPQPPDIFEQLASGWTDQPFRAPSLRLLALTQHPLRMNCSCQTRSHHPYEYFYYACERKSPEDTGRLERCTAKRVRAPELDAVVWKALCEWLQQPQMLHKEVEAWQLSQQNSQATQQETVRLEGVCRHLQGQIDHVDAYQ